MTFKVGDDVEMATNILSTYLAGATGVVVEGDDLPIDVFDSHGNSVPWCRVASWVMDFSGVHYGDDGDYFSIDWGRCQSVQYLIAAVLMCELDNRTRTE